MNRFVRARMRAAVLVHVVILLGGLVLLLLANSHTPAILSPVGYRADSSSHHEPNAQSQSLDGSVFERNASSDVSGASWQIEAMDKSARAVCVGSDVTRGEIEDLLCICLPYFHILCCSKSGTTNLFHRLRLHPQILPNNGYLGGKELLFWAWAKNGYLGRWDKGTPAPFTKYIKRFNTVARFLETSAEEKKNFQYITYRYYYYYYYYYRRPVDLHYNCYVVSLKEWLVVFPRKHFLFMRTEDYSNNIKSSLLKVFDFLNIQAPSRSVMQQMLKVPVTYHTHHKDIAGPMLPETRRLLQNYMRPCNAELADLLQDDRFLWNGRV
nr:hypothetical protein BaRGS_001205 [Batillaria attramentaria]